MKLFVLQHHATEARTRWDPKFRVPLVSHLESWLVIMQMELCGKVVPFSVISAKAKAADLCKSTLSEYASVERARRGSPSKKFVLLRSVQSVSILHLGGNFNAGHYFQENEVAQ